MQTILKTQRNLRCAFPMVVAAGLWLASPMLAGNSGASNSDLAQWQETYYRWVCGESTLPTDPNGNAEANGVVLMPLPNVPGDGTPGSIKVTLTAGQPFFLPLFGILGTSYTDRTPPDHFVDVNVFKTMKLKVTLDGQEIINLREAFESYVKFQFDPPVPYNSPPFDSIIWYQGMGRLFAGLPPGEHVLEIVAATTRPAAAVSGLVTYDNIFKITALPASPDSLGVFPPGAQPYGKSYGEWSVKHWQWVYSLAASNHPLLQDGKVDLSQGQPSGPVWFLGGSYAAVPMPDDSYLAKAERTGTVPADKALFFPLLTGEASTAEGNGHTLTKLRAAAVGMMAPASGLRCEIDGEPVQYLDCYHFESPLFTWGPLPADNLLGLRAGTTSPAVSDGYFLMLAPLQPGNHTLHFTGGVPGFTLDITYHLQATPVP